MGQLLGLPGARGPNSDVCVCVQAGAEEGVNSTFSGWQLFYTGVLHPKVDCDSKTSHRTAHWAAPTSTRRRPLGACSAPADSPKATHASSRYTCPASNVAGVNDKTHTQEVRIPVLRSTSSWHCCRQHNATQNRVRHHWHVPFSHMPHQPFSKQMCAVHDKTCRWPCLAACRDCTSSMPHAITHKVQGHSSKARNITRQGNQAFLHAGVCAHAAHAMCCPSHTFKSV